MLYIDNKKISTTDERIYVGNFINGGIKGYNICIQLLFVNIENGKKGYINLDAGFEEEDCINSFIGKKYEGVPFNSDDKQYIYFEVFDTEKFLDTEIEGNLTLIIKSINHNKVEVSFNLNDELIRIEYSGLLTIDYKITKETF